MNEPIHEKVSALISYDKNTGITTPKKIKWRGRVYTTDVVGFHYSSSVGPKILHYFSVSTVEAVSFKLCFDTETLHWRLEEIIDTSTN